MPITAWDERGDMIFRSLPTLPRTPMAVWYLVREILQKTTQLSVLLVHVNIAWNGKSRIAENAKHVSHGSRHDVR